MTGFYYNVQFDRDGPIFRCDDLEQVYALLIKKKLVSVFRYNDEKTGNKYARLAEERQMSVSEQQRLPVYAIAATSDEGVFVKDEAFWIENYLEDEFYNPDRMPYIEKIIDRSGFGCCENSF